MHLMCSLFFFLACYDIMVFAVHIKGVDNIAADGLSRDNLQDCFIQARKEPIVIPEQVMQALVLQQPGWTTVSRSCRPWCCNSQAGPQ